MYFEQLSIIVCVKSLSQLGSMIHLKLASLVLFLYDLCVSYIVAGIIPYYFMWQHDVHINNHKPFVQLFYEHIILHLASF